MGAPAFPRVAASNPLTWELIVNGLWKKIIPEKIPRCPWSRAERQEQLCWQHGGMRDAEHLQLDTLPEFETSSREGKLPLWGLSFGHWCSFTQKMETRKKCEFCCSSCWGRAEVPTPLNSWKCSVQTSVAPGQKSAARSSDSNPFLYS